MKKLEFFFLLSVCMLLWQCKPEPVPEPGPDVPEPAISIIGPSGISLGEDSGSSPVTFISAAGWTASSGEGWISVSPEAGSGSDEIVTMTVTCGENTGETSRSGEVTIASGDISRIITVTQAGRPSGPKSTECELTAVRFFSSSNPSLTETLTVTPRAIRGCRLLMITFPDGADMTNMTGSYEVSKKSRIRAGSIDITGGRTPVDFTACESLTVTAEDGEHTTDYLVIARQGDSYIDGTVYDFMSAYNIPAVSLAVTNHGQIVYTAGYGLAEAEADNPVLCSQEHLFRLASVSKTLTAVCILRLCQEGKLNLEEKVFAPGGPLASLYPGKHVPGADDIRVIDLLTHRPGWTNYTTGTDPVFTGDSRFAGKSLQKRVEYILGNVQLSYSPGTYYSYYNLGYCILGQVIEQVSGKSYETYLREVAALAGANDIWLSNTLKSKRRSNECIFYSQDGAYPYDNNMEVASACGAVIASAADMARILLAIDYGSDTPGILDSSWLDKMYTNYTSTGKGGYGLGWWIGHNGWSNWAAWHTGSLSGSATLWVRGNNGVNGVILCNSRSSRDTFDTGMSDTLDDVMTRVKQKY